MLLALGTLALVGGGVPVLADAATGAQDVGVVPAAHVARVQPAGSLVAAPSTSRPAEAAAPPVRLRLSRLDVDAPVRPVSVSADAQLVVPTDPRQVGWWSASGTPGAPPGSIVIAGHVDSATLGLGALFRLRESRAGDAVTLVDARGRSTRYTVVARRSYRKTALPAQVFALDAGPRLVLITCGGRFDQDTRHYDDNVVVYAVPR